MFINKRVISFFTIGILLLVYSPPVGAQSSVDEVRNLVEAYYVDVPSAAVEQADSIDEILSAVNDPFSNYFTEEEYEEFVQSLDQKFTGIGIYMDMVPAGVKVLSVIKGSPAEKSGIKNGDIIVKAGDASLKGLSSEKAMALLRGPAQSQVKLTIQRGQTFFEVEVTRQDVEVPTVNGKDVNNGKTGYIDIDSFGSDTARQFGEVAEELQRAKVQNWIIDLRDNPGGYLETAFEVAGYLTGEKTVINVRERDYSEVCPGVKQAFVLKGPVLVLINENSASSSEVLTSALQDYHRAVVVGEKSYGKGTVQQVFPLSGGDVLKLTVARFYSPDGDVIDHKGITPDLTMGENDDALEPAEALLGGGSLKPVAGPANIPADMPFLVNIPGPLNSGAMAKMTLIEAATGDVVPVQVRTDGKGRAVIIPSKVLTPAGEYWLLTGSANPGEGLVRLQVMGK